MTVFNFLQGGDVTVSVNGQALWGVEGISVNETAGYYEICEYLSGESEERIPLNKEFDIVINQAFTEDNPLDGLVDFSLELTVKNGKTFTYEPCCLLQSDCGIFQNKNLMYVHKIKAFNKF